MDNETKKTVLAFDTTMGGISVGVVAVNGHIVSRQMETQRGQATYLIPLIQEVLEEAHVGFKDLGLITSSVGPGSFTGLRIGLTTAKILGLALDIPLIGLSTLDVMARHYETDKPLLIVLETKRKDFYFQYFDTDRTHLSEPSSAECDTILGRAPVQEFDVGGDCLERFGSSVSQDLHLLDNWGQPDAIIMAQMGLERLQAGGLKKTVEPIYLRNADVSEPKHKPRQLKQN